MQDHYRALLLFSLTYFKFFFSILKPYVINLHQDLNPDAGVLGGNYPTMIFTYPYYFLTHQLVSIATEIAEHEFHVALGIAADDVADQDQWLR